MANDKSEWFQLQPRLPAEPRAREIFARFAEALVASSASGDREAREADVRAAALAESSALNEGAALAAAVHVIADLAAQRWELRLTEGGLEARRPQRGDEVALRAEKARLRALEHIKRDEQLRERATREFIKGMERRRLFEGSFVSVFSLIRDGRALGEALETARANPQAEVNAALREVVSPYLQVVTRGERCSHTGLDLQDIWRYFRHTWVTPYASTPGRSMAFLVRDATVPFHPIVGIGALGSPIVQISERDTWIGWQPKLLLEVAREEPSAALGLWLRQVTETALSELFVQDLLEDGVLSTAELRRPSEGTLERLSAYAVEQRDKHHRLASPRAQKRGRADAGDGWWEERARSHLYKSKRARALGELLEVRQTLAEHLGATPTPDEVTGLAASREGAKAIKRVLRKAKSDRVGTAMADITVCGAVAPYNEILCGKLVSMLSASPELVQAYERRYAEQQSEIASSMAGRPIVRPASLVFLGTTSLYGVGASQYNRLRMPAERLGGRPGERLEFKEVGKSLAFGTSHFSAATVKALVTLVQQSENGVRVNSIFGEGVSPKLRKVRQGLSTLGLPADRLLRHGRPRIVYAVPLIRNYREYLLGMDAEPDYICDLSDPVGSSSKIVDWWVERWMSMRVRNDEVLARVKAQTLVRPIRHGARVRLPEVDEAQGSLFEDLD